jgi:hypothetical protein
VTTLKLIWKTKGDDEVCPSCRILEGYTWTLTIGKDPFPTKLTHPVLGDVSNMKGSMICEKDVCRCKIMSDFSDLMLKAQKVYQTLQAKQRRISEKEDEDFEL